MKSLVHLLTFRWVLCRLAHGAMVCSLVGVSPAVWADAPPPEPASPTLNGYAEVLKPTRRAAAPAQVSSLTSRHEPMRAGDDATTVAEIDMFVGESRVFPAPGVSRIAVGNGSILTAASLDNREVILFANGVGTSSLFIWNGDGRYQRLKINIVPGDTTRHAREIATFLATIPRARASVVGANIIVEGDDMSDADIQKVDTLAKRYPQIVNFTNRVGWEQMVMMDVKMVEFPSTVLRDIGLKWSSAGGVAAAAIWQPTRVGHAGPFELPIPTGGSSVLPVTGVAGAAPVLPLALNVLGALNMGLNAQLNMLAQEGKASILAEPQLSARNGSKASFLAGGEVPYTSTNRDGTSVHFKPYGVRLEITPHVDHRGVIRATIESEVSSIDRSLSTPNGPALLSRKTETEFNLRSGETLVLSGLLQRESSDDVDKVPVLGDLPVLGALFRSRRYQNKETELVVFVTPTIVNAQSAGNTDRIERTQQKLTERMSPAPYLTEPLQPGLAYERPNALPQPAKVVLTLEDGTIIELDRRPEAHGLWPGKP